MLLRDLLETDEVCENAFGATEQTAQLFLVSKGHCPQKHWIAQSRVASSESLNCIFCLMCLCKDFQFSEHRSSLLEIS